MWVVKRGSLFLLISASKLFALMALASQMKLSNDHEEMIN